jgi:hypothetical protein
MLKVRLACQRASILEQQLSPAFRNAASPRCDVSFDGVHGVEVGRAARSARLLCEHLDGSIQAIVVCPNALEGGCK